MSARSPDDDGQEYYYIIMDYRIHNARVNEPNFRGSPIPNNTINVLARLKKIYIQVGTYV